MSVESAISEEYLLWGVLQDCTGYSVRWVQKGQEPASCGGSVWASQKA